MKLKSVSINSLSLCILLLSCGKTTTQYSQVAAFPKGPGTWYDLCLKSTAGGPGPDIARTMTAMRQAAEMDGGLSQHRCRLS